MCNKTAVSQERMRLFYPTRLIWLAFESFFPFSSFGLSFALLMPRFFAFFLISFSFFFFFFYLPLVLFRDCLVRPFHHCWGDLRFPPQEDQG